MLHCSACLWPSKKVEYLICLIGFTSGANCHTSKYTKAYYYYYYFEEVGFRLKFSLIKNKRNIYKLFTTYEKRKKRKEG